MDRSQPFYCFDRRTTLRGKTMSQKFKQFHARSKRESSNSIQSSGCCMLVTTYRAIVEEAKRSHFRRLYSGRNLCSTLHGGQNILLEESYGFIGRHDDPPCAHPSKRCSLRISLLHQCIDDRRHMQLRSSLRHLGSHTRYGCCLGPIW